jgi:hypothetical protein
MMKLLKPIEPGKYISPDKALEQIAKMPDAPEPKQPVGTFDFELGNAVKRWDPDPAKNGEWKDQDQWIDYFNKENKIMMAMPDIYQVGKIETDDRIKWLRIGFKNGVLISSTRIEYNPNAIDAKIIHYYGSTFVKPIEIGVLVSDGSKLVRGLSDFLDTDKGLGFVQALFNTTDDEKEIKKTVKRLCDSSWTGIWVPDRQQKALVPKNSACLYLNDRNELIIDCEDSLAVRGCSHGIYFIDAK